jgi:hypothetical protein
MNNKRKIGLVLFAVGAILLIGSLSADVIRIGGTTGFGYKQIIGTVAGVSIGMVGLFYALGNNP